MKSLTTFLFTAALCIGSANSATVTLIQDFFSRSGPLAGSAAVPTTSGTWSGSGNVYTTNGNNVVVAANPTSGGYYFQTIGTLQVSSNYELSVFMENTGGDSQWIGMGFGGDVSTGQSLLLTGLGTAIAYNGPTAGNTQVAGATSGFFTIKLSTGASLANSTVSFFRNGGTTQIGTPYTVNATAFDRVFIQDIAKVTGIYDNFFLTGPAVPEPSSLLLLSVAGLGLVRRRR